MQILKDSPVLIRYMYHYNRYLLNLLAWKPVLSYPISMA